MTNINTKTYWESRFGSGDWERKGGYSQTRMFAESQVSLFGIPTTFSGTICDFGCGAGDAFPVYRRAFPDAKLIGIDFSESAITLCRQKFGDIAEFICGSYAAVPRCDVIIVSNVLEHLDDDKAIAGSLLRQCAVLYIVVPFRERLEPGSEHVNSYDLTSFDYLGQVDKRTFYSKGWSFHGLSAIYQIHLKNLIRPFFGRPLARRAKQIMYSVRNAGGPANKQASLPA